MSVGCIEASQPAQTEQATVYGEKNGSSLQDPKGSDKEGLAAPLAFNNVLCPEDADFVGLSVTAPSGPFLHSPGRRP
ncbi:hypothetical protein NDU88_002270 [Pleurodeles waltl]|uniref:Uncharacterized protein n=1 Tax=Pleurodeles waltl TaxID=8319 RepID=A0AAV7L370_PLEWA|nr:hypothetical protein NDU88_002270 [Pleurodeles waltl]